MSGSSQNLWTKIFVVNNAQVLCLRRYDPDEDVYCIEVTIQAEDFFPMSYLNEVTIKVSSANDPKTIREVFAKIDQDGIQAYVEKMTAMLKEALKPEAFDD